MNIADLIINGSNDASAIKEMEKVLRNKTVGRFFVSDYTTKCSLILPKEEYAQVMNSLKD